jgi:hypothetical protein
LKSRVAFALENYECNQQPAKSSDNKGHLLDSHSARIAPQDAVRTVQFMHWLNRNSMSLRASDFFRAVLFVAIATAMAIWVNRPAAVREQPNC